MSEPALVPAAPAAATATAVVEPAPAVQPTTDPAPAPAVDLAAEVEKWKQQARANERRAKENADAAKASQEQQQLLAKVAAQLGLSEAAPDPVAITAKLEAAERASKSAARELAVLRAASRLGADGDALLDSRKFVASLEGIDVTDAEAITAAIRTAVAAAPTTYGAKTTDTTTTTPARQASTASEFNGSPGGQRQWTAEDVDRATPAEVSKAMSDGLLKNYLSS